MAEHGFEASGGRHLTQETRYCMANVLYNIVCNVSCLTIPLGYVERAARSGRRVPRQGGSLEQRLDQR
jgi:hypothetical protein